MKAIKVCFLYVFIALSMTLLGLFLHEVSHALMLVILGGSVSDISIGTISFVVGKTMRCNVPLIAMAALILPAIIVFALSFLQFKNKTICKYYACALVFLSVTPLTNNIINIFVLFFDQLIMERSAWDLILAIDYSSAEGKVVCLFASMISACLAVFAIIRQGHIFYKTFD